MKSCSDCKQILSFDLFGKCKTVKSGLTSICLSCKNKRNKTFRAAYPEIAKAYRDKHYRKERQIPERLLKCIWNGMRGRCERETSYQFNRYGGRGINIGWETYQEFRKDMLAAFLEAIKEGKNTIERIDNDGGYNKENCKFADKIEQANNRRNNVFYDFEGERLTLAQICRRRGVNYKKTWKRINMLSWPLENALMEN